MPETATDRPAPAVADAIIADVKTAVTALYGGRLARLLLYGSRARGDHRPDSDYDFLVLLRGDFDRQAEDDRIFDALWPIQFRELVSISAFSKPENALEERTGFMWNVRREAIEV